MTDASAVKISLIRQSQGYDLINASDLVITTCGTSNLEIALIGTPFIAVYRLNNLSYRLGIHLVKIPRYSIVNILAGEPLVPELIQSGYTESNLYHEAIQLLQDEGKRSAMREGFRRVTDQLRQDHKPAEIVCTRIAGELNL